MKIITATIIGGALIGAAYYAIQVADKIICKKIDKSLQVDWRLP